MEAYDIYIGLKLGILENSWKAFLKMLEKYSLV
jgi:hypothetical protein